MKKLLCIVLTAFAVAMLFTSCAAKKSNINVKIVVDQGFDGKYEETLFEETIEVQGTEPNIENIISALDNSKKVAVEQEQDEDGNMKLKSLAGKEEKEEGNMFYAWIVKVNGEDVKGLWKETKLKDGDTITFIYNIWEPSEK
jgi:molybdopterin converting factor small subunit